MDEPQAELLLDELYAMGHANVLGTHRSTMEITTEDFLTPRGNCIIATNCPKAVNNFSSELKNAIQSGKKIKVRLSAGPYEDNFYGYGDKSLKLSDTTSMVFRLSDFISERTALINCSKNAAELNRDLIIYMQDPKNRLTIRFFEDKEEKTDELWLKSPENL